MFALRNKKSGVYLVVNAEFFPISSEGEQTVCCVDETADLQAVIVPALPRAAALSSPHHVAVTALYAVGQLAGEGITD